VAAFGFIVVAALIALLWRAELPRFVAAHWGSSGIPTRTTTLPWFLISMLILGLVCVASFGLMIRFLGRERVGLMLLVGTNVSMGAFVAALLLGVLWFQRGALDGFAAGPLPGWVLWVALFVPIIPGVIAARLVPREAPLAETQPVPAEYPRAVLNPGENRVWLRRLHNRAVLWISTGVSVLLLALAWFVQSWALGAFALAFALFLVITMPGKVSVDSSGVRAQGLLGFPSVTVPANEIRYAKVTQVDPFGEYGGWGWRIDTGGRFGIVTRRGEALAVERSGGRGLTISCDDAATATALLNTYADRAR
jgi:MFS family permease